MQKSGTITPFTSFTQPYLFILFFYLVNLSNHYIFVLHSLLVLPFILFFFSFAPRRLFRVTRSLHDHVRLVGSKSSSI
ncbi:uncharacterized protein F4812DRAFT_161215 [Daldinia caldariorum]|uniref:uncharacterized protein n=1 Tax=Daldinia caldariorum TaxID=326644 RepID=UPI002008D323|nr:uncharacterized protein F4812DRAFT_161215 [Daldinia caldariorum]KAI1464624.1 hypothetical protein F4812DRAFT_161215 [Daldinia caldariorum]